MNLTERLLQALKARGATEVFGIPGDFALAAVSRDRALGAAAAAHAVARARRRLRGRCGGARARWPGRGRGDLRRRRLQPGQRGGRAYAERVPLVVLSGAPAAHEAAQRPAAAPPGEDARFAVAAVRGTHRRPRAARRRAPRAGISSPACSMPRWPRSRPVYLEIPRDMPGRPATRCRSTAAGSPPTPSAWRPVPTNCWRAWPPRERPLLMVGVEVRRYGAGGARRRTGAPAGHPGGHQLHGPRAAGRMPTCRSIGTYLGLAGDAALSERVENSDALLLLGVIVSDTNFAVSARRIDLRHAIQVVRRRRRDGPPRLSPVADRRADRCAAGARAAAASVAAAACAGRGGAAHRAAVAGDDRAGRAAGHRRGA